MLPASITQRPKQPYRAPIRQVFFSNGNSYVDELLSSEYLHKTGYFNPQKVSILVNKFRKTDQFIASETQSMALVGILSTQIVHHAFIENFTCHPIMPIEITKKVIRTR